MAAFNGTAPAVAPRDTLVSPLAFAELDLVASLHGGASPLAFSADDGATPMSLGCGCGCGKRWTEFYQDGVGDGPRPSVLPAALITTDVIADDTSTTATLTVDGDHVVSAIDTVGDQDFYAVQLVEGQTYDISMFLVAGGPNGVPLADAYIELYDADGELIVTADGGGPNTPSGLDAILTYTAESTGTYYVNARAYDEVALNGTTGDFVGDYEVFVTTVDPTEPGAYVPFYRPDSPLHSIDWGSQFTRTSRNPDGDNGTRTDNGVANGQTPIDNNAYGIVGKNVITYYFAETGDVFVSEDPTNPGLTENIVAQGMQDWEMQAFETAFGIYEQVADITYVRVYNRNEADIKIVTYEGTPGVGASLLGRMSPPGEQNAGQMEVNSGDARWTEEGVRPGGFYFPTLLHELGHGHGMAHPHDNGGRSSVMRGAEPSEDPVEGAIGGQFGDFGLSQQVYTVMSYNDGWEEGIDGGAPEGHGRPRSGGITGTEVDHFGWVGTLSALDIAVLQDKYGVNEEWATGDDTYVIGDVNEAGAYYSTIWDGGGNDEIRYTGARNANIDLRAATLRYEEGGGGRMSYALGAWTGFTIANGVTIERASSGDGDDVLIGNDADNILSGGGGRDSLDGGAGVDTASYAEASGGVSVRLARGVTQNDGSGSVDLLAGIENIIGSAFADSIIGDGGANRISGGLGVDLLMGEAGNDILSGGMGPANKLVGGLGDDRYIVEEAGDMLVERAGEGIDTVVTSLDAYELSAANVENLILRSATGATGIGNGLANRITAGEGDDTLVGKAGDDSFRGGGGDDAIYGGAGDDTAAMSGLRGQYEVVATANGYRIVDSVGDRDGADELVGIERVRFGNGETVLIADLVASAATTMSAKTEAGPQVFPGLSDDDFVMPKDAAGAPPVLPPLLDDLGVLLPDRASAFRWVDRNDLFLDADDFLQVDGGADHGLYDWM